MGVKDEVGREVDGGVQYEAGGSSLEVGRSSLARRKSCQGRPELASCYMAWLSLEWREWSGSHSSHGKANFHLGEGGRRGLGRKTVGVLQGICVKKKLNEMVFKPYTLYTTLFSAFSF